MRPTTTTPYLNRTMDRWFTPQEHLARFTSKVLVLPRGPRWEEAVSTALLGDWDAPLKRGQGLDDGTVVGQIRAEARTLHRQLVPVWRRRVRSSRMLLLETPLGDGLTLHDLVAGGLREDLIFDAAFDDPRLAAVLDGLTPIPAAPGHRAHWDNFESGVPCTESIVGWLVTERAGVLPLTADGATAEDADLMLESGEEAP
ncbi:hypothetical protein ACFUIV_27160 [Streptomyces anulatus]|uniref:hypothetical protein n=1 Tax=Streptomyces anulatus TaxID=1892 RepID=UPI00362F32E0